MFQALAGQGIDTPEKLGKFFTDVGALQGQVKNLQDQLQVLQEKKASVPIEPLTGPIVQDVKQATGPTSQDVMFQALAGQEIDTPEKLGKFFTDVRALQGQNKNLQDQLLVLQEKNKTIGSYGQEVEDLKNISATGREIQELRKVFPTTDPVNIALAARLMEGLGGGGNEIQALRKEINDLKSAQVEDRHRIEMQPYRDRQAALEQQVQNLQVSLSQQPQRGSAIDELKGIVATYNNLQKDLEGLGITTGTGEKKSAVEKALDLVGDKIMNVAEKYGLIDYVLTGGQSATGTGRPPTPPTDLRGKPYDQNEFNSSAVVWIRDAGSQLIKDQIMIDDKGFLLGYGDHIHRYIAQRKPQGVQPYITPDNHYVVPNSLSEDYLLWARQNVPQQPIPGVPPQQPGPGAPNERPRTGF